ncbi:hypothetical protein BDP27DRAFT_1372419 [Rhodocollybia butyracea]|uniref:Uncharacterized protein n=1 Tax=Rhodocollybia butyracea TaxID=206335 RepID=A0A9P5PAI3_9AGAR|nr:hypothetical protein BDP27DRAFT_1372419 [Rhodocollybia butyracea]
MYMITRISVRKNKHEKKIAQEERKSEINREEEGGKDPNDERDILLHATEYEMFIVLSSNSDQPLPYLHLLYYPHTTSHTSHTHTTPAFRRAHTFTTGRRQRHLRTRRSVPLGDLLCANANAHIAAAVVVWQMRKMKGMEWKL